MTRGRDPLEDWPRFVDEARRRLEVGRDSYSDRSFSRAPVELVEEIEAELLDLACWGYVLWHRVRALRQATEAL